MSNFFKLYHDYTKTTEPPPNFHAWSAISVISALLGKKAHIPQGHFTVFPNLYVILVGTPGTRKSTAMNIAKRFVRLVPEVPIAPDSATRESLIDDMARNKVLAHEGHKEISYWQASSFGTELEQFLGGTHINRNMVGFLTAIWDEPTFKERTRKGGEVIIHNPYFSMLSCCTPSWVSTKLQENVISDGFSRRAIFALEEEKNCENDWPETSPEQLDALAKIRAEVDRIFKITGSFVLTKEARAIHKAEYALMDKQAKNYSDKVQSYFSSKHILALKIATCLSAGVDSSRIISSNVIRAAYDFLGQSERVLDLVFSSVGRNPLKGISERALNIIRSHGEKGMTIAEYTKACYADMNSIEIRETWDMLTSINAITPVNLRSAQDSPRMKAVVANPLPPAKNLLELTSRLQNPQETKMADSQAFSLASHLAPETVQLLTRQAQKKIETDAGLLLKGMQTQDEPVQERLSS